MKEDREKFKNIKKEPSYDLNAEIPSEEILEGEIIDLRILNEAKGLAHKNQSEVLKNISNSLNVQLNFKKPILATDILRESVERMRNLNDSLLSYRNIFNGLLDGLSTDTGFGKQMQDTITGVSFLRSMLADLLKQPYLLSPVKNAEEQLVASETERALRIRVDELEHELEHYMKIISEPPQKALTAPKQPAEYDKDSKTLYIRGVEVPIDTTGRSYSQTDVCDMLFKNKKTIKDGVSNMHILEMLGHDNVTATYVKENWRTVYNIVQGINRKVTNKTFAPKYIQCRITRTRINKLYL